MAIYTFLWGVWLASPFWNVFNHAALYRVLAGLAPEYVWGIAGAIVGFIMVWGVVKHSYSSLSSGAFIGFVHWFLISLLYFIADWHNTGGITALMTSAYCAFVYLNLRMNREILESKNLVD